ncbi:MAG: hypothetical protein WC047_07405 [Kiritimatiellales bacterium]
MKILGIILAVLLVIVALLGVGLQIFLTKGLTTALNQGVFPVVKSMYGLDMSITNASVNLFKGTAELDSFAVRNLKGYTEPTLLTFDKCRLNLDMLSLLKRDPVIIKLFEAEGATLVVEQNKERQINVWQLAEALKPVESIETPVPQQKPAPQQTSVPQTAPSAEPAAPPTPKPIPVQIRRIAINVLVKGVGLEWVGNIDLHLRLTGSDLFTVPAAGQPSSLLVLRGSLAHKQDSFVTDLNAILEPLTDPRNPSFNATGSILDIDAGFLGNLLKKNNMQSSSFSIKPSITCTKGQLKGSRIDLVLNNLKIFDVEIGNTVLPIPLYDRIESPHFGLTEALNKLFTEYSEKIGKAVLQRELQKRLGTGTNTTPRDMLISGLTNNVEELQESPALQQLIEQIAPGTQATNAAVTNQSLGEAVGNALSEQLGKSVKELEGNEAVKESLKNLGKSLFGN